MSPVLSKIERREARGRARHGAREALARKDRLRSMVLENLESRTLLATIPTVVTSNPTVISGINNVNSKINDSNPTVVANPLDQGLPANQVQLVSTFSVRNANIPSPLSFFTVGAKFSKNGGATWSTVNLVSYQAEFQEPGATPPSPVPVYTEIDDASAAWDNNGNFWVLTTQRRGDDSTGAVILSKYAAGSANPTSSQVVYFWNQSALPPNTTANNFPGVLDAKLAIDTNQSTFTDPDTGATQTDSHVGNMYITWTRNTPPPPTPPSPYDPYGIDIFRFNPATGNPTPNNLPPGLVVLGASGGGNQRYSSPVMTISQGAVNPTTGATIPGGQVTVAWDDFGSLATANPPQDEIITASVQPTGNGLSIINETGAASTSVRGAASPGNYVLTSTVSPKGIGPGIAVASDNTLGAFSPHKGRLYLTYVDHYDNLRFPLPAGNDADNTDVFLLVSDDGGASWSPASSDPLTGTMLPVNDDDAAIDGYTGAAGPIAIDNGTAFRPSGRPQFEPEVAVDPTTGTVVMSFFDARSDPSRSRVVRTITASIDGGTTWTAQGSSFSNALQTATDAITGKQTTVGAYPDNQSPGNPNTESDRGFGAQQGLAVTNGSIFSVWAGNLNGFGVVGDGQGTLNIYGGVEHFAAGPRIIASTMGPVKAQNDNGNLYNNTFAADGTQQFTGFDVTFDRPIDPTSFPTSAVTVTFNPASGGASVNVPVGSIIAINNDPTQGPIKWLIRLQTPQSGVGTYTYTIAPIIRDEIRQQSLVPSPPPTLTSSSFNATGAQINLPIPADFPINGDTGGLNAPPAVSTIPVSSLPATDVVYNITVTVNLTHTWVGDLQIELFAPGNPTPIILQAQDEANDGDDLHITYDDAATQSIGPGTLVSVPNPPATFKPAQPLSGFIQNVANGNWVLQINDLAGGDHGTLTGWTLNLKTGVATPPQFVVKRGNLMDQNADGTPGDPVNDSYINPKPLTGNTIVPGTPFDPTTLPIIVPGPHIIDTSVPGASASVDNLVQDANVSALDVTFDRAMNASSFTNDQVLRVAGPLGAVNGPTTFQADDSYKATGVGQAIPDGTGASLSSTLTIPSDAGTFTIADMGVLLTIQHPQVKDLSVTLIAPDGTTVPLIAQPPGGGVSYSGANFTDTMISDGAGLTIAQGVAPYTNTFRPASSLDSALAGKDIAGTWTLRVTDSTAGSAGTLVNWALIATPKITVKAVPVYDFQSPNVPIPVPGGGVATSTLSIPIAPTGSGNVPFTIANLKIKATLVQPTNGSISSPVLMTLTSPDGSTTFSIPATATAGEIAVSTNAFNGLHLTGGNWTLTLSNSSPFPGDVGILTSWSLIATATPAFGTPNNPQTFQISFPQQFLNGTYVATIGSNIHAQAGANGGDLVDANQNAGLDLLSGKVTAGVNPVVPVTYNSSVVPVPIPVSKQSSGVTQPGTAVSTINIPDSFALQNAVISLNINFLNDPNLTATLTAPDGTVITLFSGVGNVGPQPRRNFQNTVFDDTAATPIQNGAPPFIGRFQPQEPLAGLIGKGAKGVWTLTVKNTSTTTTGSLTAWSLTLGKGLPVSGLGEPVADQSSGSFRLFSMNPTDPLSSTTWTAVGPAGIGGGSGASAAVGEPGGTGVRSSRIGGMALDPSDPSGNTVYIAGASGGIWKTTNFLTNSPDGPTYIPLTSYGPDFSLNIGSLAAFGRNNDTKQTVVFAATGEGDTSAPGVVNPGLFPSTTSTGVGFLRSSDGGASWVVLDSSTNVDASGNPLPINSPLRDHIFLGSSSYKVVVDPHPTPAGGVIVYAAISGGANQAGLWRSLDSGNTWTRMRSGQATDVTLDPNSGTIDAISNPTGNLKLLYAAFRGDGVYLSPNQGQTWNFMAGGVGDPLIKDFDVSNSPPVKVTAPPATPNGAKGRIVLAKPNLTGNASADVGYEGWLYAAVATPDDHLDGLYVTKDFGANWTKIRMPTLVNPATPKSIPIVPTNDPAQTDYDPTGGFNFGQANYDLSLVVDPNNPNVVYLGGSRDGAPSGLVRVDITLLQDPYNLSVSQDNADGGQRLGNGNGSVPLKTPANPKGDNAPSDPSNFIANNFGTPYFGPPNIYSPLFHPTLNMLRDPNAPFVSGASIYTTDASMFTNTGIGATFTPFDAAVGGTDQHRVFAFKDPLTGLSRLVFGYDQGVATAVVKPDGTFVASLGGTNLADPNSGTVQIPSGTRNGNLQINQMYYGASQPTLGAGLNDQLAALFYFNLQDNGFPQSDPNILTDGNLRYNGPGGDGAGVGTDQTGGGTVQDYRWPCCGGGGPLGGGSDFFTVTDPTSGNIAGTGRTFGLVQQSNQGSVPDPQWPFGGTINFAINPISPGANQVVISSATGNIFRTQNQGVFWSQIANGATDLDGSQSLALAYGAPDPTAPGYTGQTDNFIYVGTQKGNIFVTYTGGGSVGGGNAWVKISAGLDGSPIQAIVTNPTRTSHEAYAVTLNGVYHMVDSRPGSGTPTWVNITGNLFSILHNSFNNVDDPETLLKYLTSIQADWRYVIPNTPGQINGPTHPVLYAGGLGGVFRSFDNGATWAVFPDVATNGAPKDGGYFPSVQVSDLDLALGNINPTTGRAVNGTGNLASPNILLASTYGRGAYAIRLAPIVFQNLVGLDPAFPTQSKPGPNGTTIVTVPQPFISGYSQQTAFGYSVTVNLVDLTGVNLNDPVAVAAAEANKIIGTGHTDSFGHFSIQVNAASFTSNGPKVIGVLATDDSSGTKGNLALVNFTLQAPNLGLPTVPITPTLSVVASDITSPTFPNVTKVNRPHVTGHTDPGVTVNILDSLGNIVATGTSDANGNFTIQIAPPPGPPLADSTSNPALNPPYNPYLFQAQAKNSVGFSGKSTAVSIIIKTTAPATAPTIGILPADDTGIKGDGITAARRPHLVGHTDPGGFVKLAQAGTANLLATATADSSGNYTLQLSNDLSNGTIGLVVQESDIAGNLSPISPVFNLKIVTVAGDYGDQGAGDLAVFRPTTAQWFITSEPPIGPFSYSTTFGAPNPNHDIPIQGDFIGNGKIQVAVFRPSTAQWFIQGFAAPIQFGAGNLDIPVPGDYNGDGVTDLAVWRPTTSTFYVQYSNGGGEVVQFGQPGNDIPIPGNYDGTGKTEIAVFRRSTAQWFIQGAVGAAGPIQFGGVGMDQPVLGDFFGDGHDDLALYRQSTGQYLIRPTGPLGSPTVVTIPGAQPGDVPVPLDYDGDGKTDPSVWRPSTSQWILDRTSAGLLVTQFGWGGVDIPVVAPYGYKSGNPAFGNLFGTPGGASGGGGGGGGTNNAIIVRSLTTGQSSTTDQSQVTDASAATTTSPAPTSATPTPNVMTIVNPPAAAAPTSSTNTTGSTVITPHRRRPADHGHVHQVKTPVGPHNLFHKPAAAAGKKAAAALHSLKTRLGHKP